MLDVKLQLVVFVKAEFVGPLFEPCERWHATARRIQVISPDLICGSIFDLQYWQHGTVLPYELTQGLHTVAHTFEIVTGNRNTVSIDSQRICTGNAIFFRRARIRNMQADESRPHTTRRVIPIKPCHGTYVGNKLTCKQIIAIAICNGFVHTTRVRQRYRAFADRHAVRFGNDRPFAGILVCHRFAFQLSKFAVLRGLLCDYLRLVARPLTLFGFPATLVLLRARHRLHRLVYRPLRF